MLFSIHFVVVFFSLRWGGMMNGKWLEPHLTCLKMVYLEVNQGFQFEDSCRVRHDLNICLDNWGQKESVAALGLITSTSVGCGWEYFGWCSFRETNSRWSCSGYFNRQQTRCWSFHFSSPFLYLTAAGHQGLFCPFRSFFLYFWPYARSLKWIFFKVNGKNFLPFQVRSPKSSESSLHNLQRFSFTYEQICVNILIGSCLSPQLWWILLNPWGMLHFTLFNH